MKLSEANLSDKTLKYIEYLAQEKGQKALDKYLKWTGWYEVGNASRQTSVESRLDKAAKHAETWRNR